MLEEYGRRQLLEITDMTELVSEQRQLLRKSGVAELKTPSERTYIPSDPKVARRLKLNE